MLSPVAARRRQLKGVDSLSDRGPLLYGETTGEAVPTTGEAAPRFTECRFDFRLLSSVEMGFRSSQMIMSECCPRDAA